MKYLLLLLGFFSLSFTTPNPAEKLKVGAKSFQFVVKDVYGKKINLRRERRKNKVLLVFLRHAWCPVCNARTHELIKDYSKLKAKGIEVIVVYQSKQKILLEYAQDYKLPFRVVADPDEKLYALYMLEDNKKKILHNLNNGEKTAKRLALGGNLYTKGDRSKYRLKEDDKSLFYMPGDFLISKKGYIELAFYGEYYGHHLAIADVLKFVASTNTTSPQKIQTNTRF